MTNSLRMSFAEWLSRMAERDLAPPGRTIAIYAAVFDITGNDQLAQLTGIQGRSLDKWKKALLTDGWVLIEGKIGGRGHGIHVSAALDEIPVSFTDLKPKKGSKYYPRNSRQTPAEFADDIEAETPAKVAEPPQNLPPFRETPAENTGVISATHSASYNNYTRAEGINIYNKNNIYNLTAREQQALADLLLGSCNGALDNPVNCQGLLNLSIPMMWIENDCDLSRDIIPTLTAIGKAKHGARLRTWKYFTGAVEQARDARLTGMQAKQPSGGSRPAPSAEDTIRQIDAIVRGGR